MIIVSGCSCTQSMCTDEDLKSIENAIKEKYKEINIKGTEISVPFCFEKLL